MTKLIKPCPFCGGKVKIQIRDAEGDLRDEDQTDIYDENGHIYPYICVCPNCKKPTIYDFEYNVKFDYCRDCGQRILWEE